MMRKLFVAAMVAFVVGLIGMGGLARDAQAGATIDLLFVSRNGAPIAPTSSVLVNPGDTLRMAVRMSHDLALGLTFHQFGIEYDTDGDNELELLPFGKFAPASTLGAVSWGGIASTNVGKTPSMYGPFLSNVTTGTQNFVNAFQSNVQLIGSVLPAGSGYQVGTVSWTVRATVNTDGTDILPGINLQGVKGQDFQTAGGASISTAVRFNGAAVNLIPEPGTAALLGLGLVGMVVLGRRRSRP